LFEGAGVPSASAGAYAANQIPINQPTPAPRVAPSVNPQQLPQAPMPSAQPVAASYPSPAG
jgi:hypothetical protein